MRILIDVVELDGIQDWNVTCVPDEQSRDLIPCSGRFILTMAIRNHLHR